MKNKFLILALALFSIVEIQAARPRLVINIVAGSMRAEDMGRYAHNFSREGLGRLLTGGAVFNDSRYDYQQTTLPVSLATLSTGALPSTHGIIGERWYDYTSNRPVYLLSNLVNPRPDELIAPTLSETLLRHAPGSHSLTVALDPVSAIVMNGRGGSAFWMNEQCEWATSRSYAEELPQWIVRSNREKYNLSYAQEEWNTMLDADKYVNTRHWDIKLSLKKHSRNDRKQNTEGRLDPSNDFERICYTPAGNTAVFGFAKQAIVKYHLGEDDTPDILNICLDSAQRITEAYGPESVEVEDMIYRLDNDLADFLTFVLAQHKEEEVVVVFTAAHGSSPSFEEDVRRSTRFNTRQFEVIVNGFLNVRYGNGNWVLACENKCLWLNHNLIYERGLNLSEVQNEVAIFAMQFSGVSHALAASAMRTSYFGSGYARKLQNSFYPRRSGDVILNLMPGWIEEKERCWSVSGSMYGYDTQVPLIFFGGGIAPQRIARRIDLTSVAPTLSHLMGITEPAASEGVVLDEIVGR